MMRRYLLAVLPLFLMACEPSAYWDGVPSAQKVETFEQVEDVALHFDKAARQVSAVDGLTLAQTMWRGQKFGSISLDVLTAADPDPVMAASLSRLIAAQGVPTDRIKMRVSPDLDPVSAVVRVHAIQVRVPVCAGIPTASTSDTTRLDKRTYVIGCATTANLANMLVDPRDLSADPVRGSIDAERTIRPIGTLRTKSEGKKANESDGGGGLRITSGGGSGSSSSQ